MDILDPNHHHGDDLADSDPAERDLTSELSSILPGQTFSVTDSTLQLEFVHNKEFGPHAICRIKLYSDASPGCGGIAWPAGQILASHLVKGDPTNIAGKKVIELGSGTGLVGLVAAKLGAKVWITDQEYVR
jgi:protein N-lysine methyltransferase METTL21A